MAFNSTFAKKRAHTNSKEPYDVDGIPLYSARRTAGTELAEKLLKEHVKPLPVPPRKYNGPFR